MNACEIVNCLKSTQYFTDWKDAVDRLLIFYPHLGRDTCAKVFDLVKHLPEGQRRGYLYFSSPNTLEFMTEDQWCLIHNTMIRERPGDQISKAVEIAARDHGCQRDKGGQPYIKHVLRVAMALEADGASDEEIIMGFLHDVVEDSETSLADLKYMGFQDTVLRGVDAVTKREGETVQDKAARISQHEGARRLKLKDLQDNMNLTRLKNRASLTEKDWARIKDYAWLFDYLSGGRLGSDR